MDASILFFSYAVAFTVLESDLNQCLLISVLNMFCGIFLRARTQLVPARAPLDAPKQFPDARVLSALVCTYAGQKGVPLFFGRARP